MEHLPFAFTTMQKGDGTKIARDWEILQDNVTLGSSQKRTKIATQLLSKSTMGWHNFE